MTVSLQDPFMVLLLGKHFSAIHCKLATPSRQVHPLDPPKDVARCAHVVVEEVGEGLRHIRCDGRIFKGGWLCPYHDRLLLEQQIKRRFTNEIDDLRFRLNKEVAEARTAGVVVDYCRYLRLADVEIDSAVLQHYLQR